jgi:uncharacterized Tic20 family protein
MPNEGISPIRPSDPRFAEVSLADDDHERRSPDTPSDGDRSMAVLCHLGGYFTIFVVPLILWLTNKRRSRFVAAHGKEALNFQLFLTGPYLLWVIALGFLIGMVLTGALATNDARFWFLTAFAVVSLVGLYETLVVILASIAAWRGRPYRCPCIYRFIK